jgi:hypothetical protein
MRSRQNGGLPRAILSMESVGNAGSVDFGADWRDKS